MVLVDLVLKNCKIVTSKEIIEANIAVDEGKIFQIAKVAHTPKGEEEFD